MGKEENNKNKKAEEWGRSKIWLSDEEIICINISNMSDEKDINGILEKTKELLEKFKGKRKILIALSSQTGMLSQMWHTFQARTVLAEKTKSIFKEPGFEKAAIFGGNTTKRVVAAFIITASGVKNVKVFETEEEASNWLKKP